MQLLYRINRTGTTVLVATHDHAMVDKMRRRVIELAEGQIVRDEIAGLYAGDESTREFAARMRGAVADPDFDWIASPPRTARERQRQREREAERERAR
jgi:cell division transport system ATP-binding protein